MSKLDSISILMARLQFHGYLRNIKTFIIIPQLDLFKRFHGFVPFICLISAQHPSSKSSGFKYIIVLIIKPANQLPAYRAQLFGLASWRKIECQFWAFNTQWDFGSKSLECAKLNILIKYVNNTCWNYFLVTLEMLGYHWKFFGGSRMARKARKRDKCEKTWIL